MLLSWLLLYWAQAGKNYAVSNLYYLELPVISIFLTPILMWKELKKDYLVLKRNLMLLTMADNDRVGIMLTISPPTALGGEILDMVKLWVIFFHDFNMILWFQRLGAEATAEAIADMYENHNAVPFRCAYLGPLKSIKLSGGEIVDLVNLGGRLLTWSVPFLRDQKM